MGKQENQAAKRPRIRRSIVVVAFAIVVVSLAVGIALLYEGPQQTFFKGAYGVYQGVYSSSNSTAQITSRLEVVDLNDTVATFTQNITFVSNGTAENYNATMHYDLLARHFDFSNLLNGTYPTDITFNGVARPCLAYQYVVISGTEWGTTTVYYDNATGWILKQVTLMPAYNYSFNLVQTNVPGL
jgi:hypothetical protein